MTTEEQQQIDEEARRAALRSMATIEPARDEALFGREDLSAAPSLADAHPAAAQLPARDYDPAAAPSPAAPPVSAELPTRDHLGNEDPSSGSVFGPDDPSESQSGPLPPAAPTPPAIQPMAPSAPPTLARDDAEPMGSVARYGQRAGQMTAPSGASEDWQGRFQRLGVGGDFSPAVPPAPADASATVRARLAPAPAAPPADRASALASPVRDGKPPVDAAREAAAGPLPRLDDGLPSEADIAGAREGIGDSILRHLQNGLRGAIGQAPREAPTRADELAAERRSGIRAGLERKGLLRGQEATAASTAARQAEADRRADQGLAIRQQQADASTALSQQRGGLIDAQTEHTQLTTEDLRGETMFRAATREQREDPTSAASVGMRRAVEARLALMGPSGDQEREILGSLDQYNANQLHDVLPSLMQGVGLRVRGAGTPGAARSTAPGSSLAEQYVAHGISPDLASAQALITSLGGPEDTHAISRLDRRLDEETPPPPTGSVQANVAAAQTSADELHRAIGSSGGDIPGIGRLDGMLPTVALGEDGRRIRALVLNLSDNYLRMVSGAAIPAHEIESFAQRLGANDEPIFREQVERIRREIAARQTGSSASPATADHRRPATQARPEAAPTAGSASPDDFSSMTDEELQAIAAEGG